MRIKPCVVFQALATAVSAVGWTRRGLARVRDVAFGANAGLLLALAVPLALALAMLLPRLAWRRRAATVLARAFVTASGLPVQASGTEHFPATGPLIVVANHASYVDGPLLITCLPERCNFVAKRELAGSLAVGLLLRRIATPANRGLVDLLLARPHPIEVPPREHDDTPPVRL